MVRRLCRAPDASDQKLTETAKAAKTAKVETAAIDPVEETATVKPARARKTAASEA